MNPRDAVVIQGDGVDVHLDPLWQDRANALITADLASEKAAMKWEQLWARRLGENLVEICCFPFFTYHLALGDHVETDTEPRQHITKRVAKRSGHDTFRVWFGDSTYEPAAVEVVEESEWKYS